MPPILYAQITTGQASRYLVQFCKHATAVGAGGHTPRMHLHPTMARREVQVTADWSDTSGTVTFTPWGRCTLTADDDTLTVHLEAADDAGLTQIRDVVDRDLQRFSRRDPLMVNWQRPPTPGATPFRPSPALTPQPRRGASRTRLQTVLLAVAAVLVIAVHVGVAGTAVAHSRWTGIAVDAMAALLVLKIALLAWAHFAGRARTTGTRVTHDRGPS